VLLSSRQVITCIRKKIVKPLLTSVTYSRIPILV